AADGAAILRNDVYYLGSLPRWSTGRVALLGDAAHATTPGVGQGAAQAIEDAVALGKASTRPGTSRPRSSTTRRRGDRAPSSSASCRAALPGPAGWRAGRAAGPATRSSPPPPNGHKGASSSRSFATTTPRQSEAGRPGGELVDAQPRRHSHHRGSIS